MRIRRRWACSTPARYFRSLHRCAELGRVHVHGGKLAFPDIAAVLTTQVHPSVRGAIGSIEPSRTLDLAGVRSDMARRSHSEWNVPVSRDAVAHGLNLAAVLSCFIDNISVVDDRAGARAVHACEHLQPSFGNWYYVDRQGHRQSAFQTVLRGLPELVCTCVFHGGSLFFHRQVIFLPLPMTRKGFWLRALAARPLSPAWAADPSCRMFRRSIAPLTAKLYSSTQTWMHRRQCRPVNGCSIFRDWSSPMSVDRGRCGFAAAIAAVCDRLRTCRSACRDGGNPVGSN